MRKLGPNPFLHPLQYQVVRGVQGFSSITLRLQSLCLSLPPPSLLPRVLEARAQNEFFRAFFRLPRREKLHAVLDCSLWTPFSRCHTAGRMFASDSYICFASKEDGCCKVILPLREVDAAPILSLGPWLP